MHGVIGRHLGADPRTDWSRDSSTPKSGLLGAMVLGIVAALPVTIATIQVIRLGWTPSNDDGVIAVRAFDVFSAHSPLVGQYSQASLSLKVPVYSLGPLLYWVLALPAHLGPTALVLTMAAISVVSIIGVVVLAERRGGKGLMFMVAIAVVIMFRSLPVQVPYEIWNPWAGLIPFVALIFVSWSVACGDVKLLPLLVLVASYVVQCHLTYLVPTTGCLAVAVCGLGLRRLNLVRDGNGRGGGLDARPVIRRWIAAAGLVFVLVWVPPLIQEVSNHPGNLTLVIRSARSEPVMLGKTAGMWEIARAIGLSPLWLKRPLTARENLEYTHSPLAGLTALVVLIALGFVLAIGLRRRRFDVTAAAALGLVLAISLGIVTRSIPGGIAGYEALQYVLIWASPAGMFVYVALAWSVWCLWIRPRAVKRAAPPLAPAALTQSVSRRGPFIAFAAILAVSLVVANRPGSSSAAPARLGSYDMIRALTTKAVDALDRRRAVLLNIPNALGSGGQTVESTMAYEMRRRGISFAVPPRLADELGAQYCPKPASYPDVVTISEGDVHPARGTRLLASSSDATISVSQAPSLIRNQQEAAARADDNVANVPSHCARTTR